MAATQDETELMTELSTRVAHAAALRDVKERRRPGRPETISPELVRMLRNPARPLRAHDQLILNPEQPLGAAYGIAFGVAIGVGLWAAGAYVVLRFFY